MQQNPLTRRRFLLDLVCVGGVIALTAGLAMERELHKPTHENTLIAHKAPIPEVPLQEQQSCTRPSYNAAGGVRSAPPATAKPHPYP